jgi:hypothetical protein
LSRWCSARASQRSRSGSAYQHRRLELPRPIGTAFQQLNPVTPLTAAAFADPPQNDMPWVRWNFAPATAAIAGLETELEDMREHNIAGVEIGQGGVPTNVQLIAIYKKATALGITVGSPGPASHS